MMKKTITEAICFILFSVVFPTTTLGQLEWRRIENSIYIDELNTQNFLADVRWSGNYLVGCGRRVEGYVQNGIFLDSATTQYLAYSIDSGKTWIRAIQPFKGKSGVRQPTLNRMEIIDTNIIIACGGNNTKASPNIVKSNDGGKTWHSIVEKFDTIIHQPKMSFYGKKGVMVGTTEFRFHRTDDGGETWTSYKSSHPQAREYYSYSNFPVWIDSTTIFVSSYDLRAPSGTAGEFRTFISYDAGKNWKQLGCTIKGYEADSSFLAGFLTVHFPAPDRGYANGKIFRHGLWLPTIFTSYDKGLTWNIADTLPNWFANESVYEQNLGKDTFVYVTIVGKVRFTSDGGKTWRFITEQELKTPFGNDATESISAAYFFSLQNAICLSLLGQRLVDRTYNPSIYRLQKTVSSVNEEVDEIRLESIEEVRSVYLLSATPIPAHESLTLRTFTVMEAGGLSLKLYDFYGREVADYSEELRMSAVQKGWANVTIPVLDLVNGVYIARISSNKHSHTMPVLILR